MIGHNNYGPVTIYFIMVCQYVLYHTHHTNDHYVVAQSLLPIDPQQDWNLIRGENEVDPGWFHYFRVLEKIGDM